MPKDTFFNLPEKKRSRIVDSAFLEFSKVHYKQVTIDSIVNGAGIPKGSFYQYFTNKDDLYKYLFSQIGNEKKHVLEEMKKYKEQLNFREYLIKMLEESKKFESEDTKLMELKNKFINECPQEVRKDVLKNEIPKSYRLLEEVISGYVKKGELRKDLNIKTAAYMITSCVVSLEDYEFDKEENISEVIIRIIDILINGLK
ncbi:TetR/AcrR family transcriptional regulator [Vallitalea maricola]|uniref:TetR/AcrR family transcriptional regulator n=1 Tax=Vallitalea maricola TaxID=3074433 RepID=A0ACB5UIV8_9FIRM|nr:TetR/AcrR family transcriptional regulator [Vallitalea sp. AN17-2]